MDDRALARRRTRRRLLLVALLAAAIVVVAALGVSRLGYLLWQRSRDAPATAFTPPVVAGRWVYGGGGSAAVYARGGDTLYVTTAGHSITPGSAAQGPDGAVIGTFGAAPVVPACPDPRHQCKASDISAIELLPKAIPWGHLNVIDMGSGGARVLAAGTRPLACADIAVGDAVEIAGAWGYRTGHVLAIGEYLFPQDGDYFACMVHTDVPVGWTDSGGIVLVNGEPGGVVAREFGGRMGFTPLAEGLEALGLTLCTTPDCDLERPTSRGSDPVGP